VIFIEKHVFFLKVKARVEGFERYFEQIFGPKGPLSKANLKEQVDKLRFYRSADEAEELRGKIDDLNYKNEALKHRFPVAELGVKVFGNEISFWTAEGEEEIMKSLQRLNPQLRILEILSGKVWILFFNIFCHSSFLLNIIVAFANPAMCSVLSIVIFTFITKT
jgi:hypothetical protein